jgi:glyoxylase-like metal-dependent hydrolase (beta-lactamase superfamily II)
MVDQIFPDIFRIEIPLPGNPLKAINSYVIRGDGRFLVIDTGMKRDECRKALEAGIQELAVDLDCTDFFITHLHADHLGLVTELVRGSSKVYFNAPDAKIINDPDHWDNMIATALANGFPEEEIDSAILKHPGRRYQACDPLDFALLQEGDRVSIGAYDLQCVSTPGHTRGHLCLYEPRAKIFFSGDHILEDITPNISLWAENVDPLRQYLESLDKITLLDVCWVFPGHRRAFTHCKRRIEELKQHHAVRAGEIRSILKEGRQSAYQVASRMTWDISCKHWEDFPISQKWFASGEALSHLQYLHGENGVRREQEDGKIYYSLILDEAEPPGRPQR